MVGKLEVPAVPRSSRSTSVSLAFGCLLLWVFCVSNLRVPAQEYVFRSYRQAQGLENLSVTSLAWDTQGFLWVGTENGVYRFVGSGFQRFGAADGIREETIAQVFASADGTVWVGTGENLYRWTGRSFEPAMSKPLAIRQPAAIAALSAGHLLVISGHSLYGIDYAPAGKAASRGLFFSAALRAAHPALDRLGSVAALPNGTFWMACGQRLCSWEGSAAEGAGAGQRRSDGTGGILTEWNETSGVPKDFFHSVFFAPNGSLWAAGEHHLIELRKGTRTFVDRSLHANVKNGTYARHPLACDRLGRVLSSFEGGVARWDGASWHVFGKANGLNSTHITALQFDARGDLWMGSTGHGLHHWVGYEDWEGWTDRQGLPSSNIWSVKLFGPGKAFIGTESGTAALDLQTGAVTASSPTDGWKYGQVTGMEREGDGSILAATASGLLLRIRQHPDSVREVANLRTYIYRLFKDFSGRIFALSFHGIFDVSDLGRRAPVLVPEFASLLGASPVVDTACASPGGSSWYVDSRGLVEHFPVENRDGWARPEIRGMPKPAQALRDVACAPDGTLWVTAGDSALWHLVRRDGHLQATQLALPEAFRSFALLGTAIDRHGWLWLGTDAGVVVWSGSSWRLLTQERGLIWNDVNESELAVGPDDTIWIGTSAGLAHILHPEAVFSDKPPQMALLEVRRGAQVLDSTGRLDMPWSRLDLSFAFAAPEVVDRKNLVFRYRIDSLQSVWAETLNESVRFELLPPGDYTFEVFALDRASDLQSTPIIVKFRIRPPWWRTGWFYAFLILSGCCALLLLYNLRTRQLLARQRHLEEIVRKRTEQLEASREKLRKQATHDSLTGLLNRAAILSAFETQLLRGLREGTPITLVLGDIDHFKRINDTYGHLAGDEALRCFSLALTESVRAYDSVGRYGGEEFLIVLAGIGKDQAAERLSSLHGRITNLVVKHGITEFSLTCSLGAVCVEHFVGVEPNSVLAAADSLLYEAKGSGRNRFLLGEPIPLTGSEEEAALHVDADPDRLHHVEKDARDCGIAG